MTHKKFIERKGRGYGSGRSNGLQISKLNGVDDRVDRLLLSCAGNGGERALSRMQEEQQHPREVEHLGVEGEGEDEGGEQYF